MRTAAVGILLIVLVGVGLGQQPSASVRPDSVVIRRMTIQGPEFSVGRSTLLLPSSAETDLLLKENPAEALRFAMLLPEARGGSSSEMPDVASSLRLDKSDNMAFLRVLLGSVQAGGAAYLAYRHIKKYGLFH